MSNKEALRHAYVFRSFRSVCKDCLKDIAQYNEKPIEGNIVKCISCGNKFEMILLAKPNPDDRNYGIMKSDKVENFDIFVESILVDKRIYETEERFLELCKRYNLVGSFMKSKEGEHYSIYNSNSKYQDSLERLYSPLIGAVAVVVKVDI